MAKTDRTYISVLDARDLADMMEGRPRKSVDCRATVINALLDMECESYEPQGDDGQNLNGLAGGNAVGSESWQRRHRIEIVKHAVCCGLYLVILCCSAFCGTWFLRVGWFWLTGR